MINLNDIKKLEVKIPAKPVKGEKCYFSVEGMDGINDIAYEEKEININEYQTENREYFSFNVYGKWQAQADEQTESARSIVRITGLLKTNKQADNVFSEMVLKIQKAQDGILLVIPRYVMYEDGEPIAICYISDIEPENDK